MPDLNSLNYTIAMVAVIGAVLSLWRWARPIRRQSTAVADAILGREEIKVRGRVIQEAQPGLVQSSSEHGQRLKIMEDAVLLLTQRQVDVGAINGRIDRLAQRVAVVEGAQEERTAIRRETEALLRAVADRDVLDVESDETPGAAL